MAYIYNTNNHKLENLKEYCFKSEGKHKVSPQEILAKYPNIITDILQLDLYSQTVPLVRRELSFERKPIDILYITQNADIILVETKLLRNPESQRLVVAQVIDYIKTLVKISPKDLLSEMQKSKYSDKSFQPDDFFTTTLNKNLSKGNFSVVIAGDKIHPNILEMVDSIQAVPHLSFTIFLVELQPLLINDENILFSPSVISQTIEIERSVVKIEIAKDGGVKIDSEIPKKEGKGSKPIITDEEYIENLPKPEFGKVFQFFWQEWKKVGGDIRFGTVGFSSGIKIQGKRKPIQFAYQNKVTLISDNHRQSLNISDDTYSEYVNFFEKELNAIYDQFIVGNLVAVPFDILSETDLEKILNAAFIILDKEYGIKL